MADYLLLFGVIIFIITRKGAFRAAPARLRMFNEKLK